MRASSVNVAVTIKSCSCCSSWCRIFLLSRRKSPICAASDIAKKERTKILSGYLESSSGHSSVYSGESPNPKRAQAHQVPVNAVTAEVGSGTQVSDFRTKSGMLNYNPAVRMRITQSVRTSKHIKVARVLGLPASVKLLGPAAFLLAWPLDILRIGSHWLLGSMEDAFGAGPPYK